MQSNDTLARLVPGQVAPLLVGTLIMRTLIRYSQSPYDAMLSQTRLGSLLGFTSSPVGRMTYIYMCPPFRSHLPIALSEQIRPVCLDGVIEHDRGLPLHNDCH